jgi:hypothetical protein
LRLTPHHREAHEHLIRIRRRIAADAVEQQLVLTGRAANFRFGEVAQGVLMVANQAEPNRL